MSQELQNLMAQIATVKVEAFDEISEKARMVKHWRNEATKAKQILVDVCNKLNCKPESLDKTLEEIVHARS